MSKWTKEEEAKLIDLYPTYARLGRPLSELAEEFEDRTEASIERKSRVLRKEGKLRFYKDYREEMRDGIQSGDGQVTVDCDGDSIHVSSEKSSRIRTKEQLLQAADVDLDIYECPRYTVNKWEVGAKDADGNIRVEPLFQVKCWLTLKEDAQIAKAVEKELLKKIKDASPFVPDLHVDSDSGDLMFEPAIYDIHLGKRATEEECTENWSFDLTERVFVWSIKKMIQKAQPYKDRINQIVFPIGNDFFHFDDLKGHTTYGTFVDSTLGFQEMFNRGFELIRWAIDAFSDIAPVKIVVVPGNHDQLSSFCLGAVVEAYYHNNENVEVDNSARIRKYHRYGKTMLCFTHGRHEKHKDLPMLMAGEQPGMWAKSYFREAHVGDKHQKKTVKFVPFRDFEGVGVRIIPSLTSTDVWHFERGYTNSARGAEAYLWNEEKGLEATFHINLPRRKPVNISTGDTTKSSEYSYLDSNSVRI